MKLICTMPVRNEDWCVGLTARAALMACDELIVHNHASTDGTEEILCQVREEHPGRVFVITELDPVWNECRHRQLMLDWARTYGATHIATIDADEILTSNFVNDEHWQFSKTVERAGMSVLQLPWICLARSLDKRYSTGVWGTNFVSCGFYDYPELHWRAPHDGYDFHHRHPMGMKPSFNAFRKPIEHHAGGLMHLQFVNERRLKAKQALYKMTEVLRWPGRESTDIVNARYNRAVYESLTENQPLADVPSEWWSEYSHLMHHLDLSDQEPWQERQCKAWCIEYGAARFKGLDLFGVV
jgi:hypothetical protein